MATDTGPPTGTLKLMTPFKIAPDPPTPKPIPDLLHPDKSPAERAAERFSLAGKRAIVTGGAQGLGLVCARALLEHGVQKLAIFDVDESMGQKAVTHLQSTCGNNNNNNIDVGNGGGTLSLLFKNVDVSDEKAVNGAVQDVADQFDGVDILLCFAGITESKLSVEYDIDSWRRIFDVNVHGCFLVARAVARTIIARPHPSASIILISSMSAHIVNTPQPHPAYAVSKAGVHHLARSLAGEWVAHGIRVNSISPGIMNTRLSGGESQRELRKLWLEKSPLGIGEPEDLTGAVVLLCGAAGRFITGTDVRVDGGYTIF